MLKFVPHLLAAMLLLTTVAVAATPASNHVVVIPFENHSYSAVVGSGAMPYLNSLINDYSLATNYYANVHGSVGDYFMVTTGNLVSTSTGYAGPWTGSNLARSIGAVGKTWKVYAQSLPADGYLGNSTTTYPYVKWHNPFAYFSDVTSNPSLAARIVQLPQLSTDTAMNTLPNFAFVVPDNRNNAHDCPSGGTNCTDFDKLHAADLFLQSWVPKILSTPAFQQDGILVIWWDEGGAGDTANGGGRVAITVIGSNVKRGHRSTTFYKHENLLRTFCEALRLSSCPGAAASVVAASDMFVTTSTSTGTVTGKVTNISNGLPLSGAQVTYSGGSASTNGQGVYTLTNVPAGTQALTARSSGYVARTLNVNVVSGATSTLNFAIATGGRVAGTVKNTSGAAIAGAKVALSGGAVPTRVTLTTSSTGTYSSNWIPIGSYTATVSATGYVTKTASVSVSTGKVTTANFTLTK